MLFIKIEEAQVTIFSEGKLTALHIENPCYTTNNFLTNELNQHWF